MSVSIKELLAERGINPSEEHLQKLEAKWAEVQELKGNLAQVRLDDADIALRNTPGGDHVD